MRSERLHVLGVFRLSHEKNPLLFVKAAAEIAKAMPNVDFSIVGSGSLEPDVTLEINRQNLGDRVTLLGWRPDVLQIMKGADLLLHTASIEGMPNVLIEAQAMGLPVVATNAGGTLETVVQNKTAIVVPRRNPDVLAKSVVRCFKNKKWMKAASQAGPQHVNEKFGIDTMMKSTLIAYNIKLKPIQQTRCDD